MTTTAMRVARVLSAKVGFQGEVRHQKLTYYCQAWHLARFGTPLFSDEIQAWRDGPVTLALRNREPVPLQPAESGLSEDELAVIDYVAETYGEMFGYELTASTHAEYPYREARRNRAPSEPGSQSISQESMQRYYSRLALTPGEAVHHAIASAGAEGVEVGPELEWELLRVASGEVHPDDAVAELVARYQEP